MAVASGQVALNASTTTAIIAAADAAWLPQRDGPSAPTRDVSIINTSAITVYLGTSAVTSSTGYQLVQNGVYRVFLFPDEVVYGISASATPTVSYIESGS